MTTQSAAELMSVRGCVASDTGSAPDAPAMPKEWLSRLRSISGADAISWPGWWVTTALGVVLQVLGSQVLSAGFGQFAVRTLVFLAAQAAMFAVLVLAARPLLLKPWMQGRWLLAFGIFASAGVLRAVLQGVFAQQMGVTLLQAPLGRILTSAATVAIVLTFTAVVVQLVRQSSEQRATLADDQQRLATLRTDAIRELEHTTRETVQQIRNTLMRTFGDLQLSGDGRPADSLRATVDEVVRPISHELATRVSIGEPTPAETAAPRIDWRETTRTANSHFAIYPFSTTLGAAYLGLASNIPIYGAGRGPLIAVANALILWGTLSVARWMGQRPSGRRSPRRNALLMIVAVLVGELLLLPLTFRTDQPWDMLAGSLVIVPAIAWAVNLAAALLQRQIQLQQELAQTAEQVRADMVRVREVQWARRRSLATAVHGPLQSVITAAAIRMDLAAAEGRLDQLDIDEIQQQILAAIDRLDCETTSDSHLESAVTQLQRTWRGVCSISLTQHDGVEAELSIRPETTHAVTEITQEACSNAVRHGRADTVDIEVALADTTDPAIELTIRNNGRLGDAADSGSHAPGLGTAILDELTLRWRRDTTSEGCTLHATVPLVEPTPIP